MPYCTMCGAELAPNAKFCGACGTAVEQDTPAQPTTQQPQYQQVQYQQHHYQQPAPQQPQYQQPAPQQPQYQQAPQQPQYQQQAPQQPQYQPQYQQQYQQPAYQPMTNKSKVDFLPNAEHSKTTRFTWGGLAGAILTIVLLFMTKNSGWKPSSTYYALTIVAQGLTCIAMVNIYLSLKKGLVDLPAAMLQLLKGTAILNVVMSAITIAMAILVVVGGADLYSTIKTLSDIYPVAALAYLACSIIVGVKLLMTYEGKMKTMAITLLVIPAVSLLVVLLETSSRSRNDVAINLLTIGIQGASCYLYYLAHQIFTGRKLF